MTETGAPAGLGSTPSRRGQPWTPAEVETLTLGSTRLCPQHTRLPRPRRAHRDPISTGQLTQAGAGLWPGDRPLGNSPGPHSASQVEPRAPPPAPPEGRALTGSMSMVPGGPGSPSAPGRPGRPGGPCGQRGRESQVSAQGWSRARRDASQIQGPRTHAGQAQDPGVESPDPKPRGGVRVKSPWAKDMGRGC